MHIEYNMATKTDGWDVFKMKSYYEKLLKEGGGGRAKRSGEETLHMLSDLMPWLHVK